MADTRLIRRVASYTRLVGQLGTMAGLVLRLVGMIGSENAEQEEKIIGHLTNAINQLGMAEAALLSLEGLIGYDEV